LTEIPGLVPHLPRRVPIEGFGKGGFRFADMSHRGSLLCLPSGLWAWAVTNLADVDDSALARVLAEADQFELFLLGTGADRQAAPQALALKLRTLNVNVETMRTGSAVSTYNILLNEGRRIAAGLIAVD
jgi:uncharacterized protein